MLGVPGARMVYAASAWRTARKKNPLQTGETKIEPESYLLLPEKEITMSDLPYFMSDPVAEVEFITVDAYPTVVRKVTDYPMSEMSSIYDSTFSALIPALTREDIRPAGPAFDLHRRMPTDTATFELGFPVSRALDRTVTEEPGIILEPSILPGGTIARISYIGPYDGLPNAWGLFMEAIAAAGEETVLPFWQIYVTEPKPDGDASQLRTDLVILVKS